MQLSQHVFHLYSVVLPSCWGGRDWRGTFFHGKAGVCLVALFQDVLLQAAEVTERQSIASISGTPTNFALGVTLSKCPEDSTSQE